MELFFEHASPTTLASLIADLQNADEWTDAINTLNVKLHAELVAIVGKDEAADLLLAAGA